MENVHCPYTPIIDTGGPGAKCGEKNADRGCATGGSYSAVTLEPLNIVLDIT